MLNRSKMGQFDDEFEQVLQSLVKLVSTRLTVQKNVRSSELCYVAHLRRTLRNSLVQRDLSFQEDAEIGQEVCLIESRISGHKRSLQISLSLSLRISLPLRISPLFSPLKHS